MRSLPRHGCLVLVLTILTVTLCAALPNDGSSNTSLTTQERVYTAGWWPTKGDPARKEYAGEAVCATCHADIASIQHTTPMYRAAVAGDRANASTQHSGLKFKEGGYRYAFDAAPSGMTFTVTDGNASESRPVAWAFGNAEIGQTYLLKQDNRYVESRLSYYTAPNALDITTGHSETPPSNLHEALGHVLSEDTAQRCFNCHMTAATVSDAFQPDQAVAGVTCEACHGPGREHASAMSAKRQSGGSGSIANPGTMSPSDSVDFCGACHRTFADVKVFMPANLGVVSVRFQPYRLEKSACWGKNGDARITCIACHDPHLPLVKETAAYDSKCLACHRVAGASQPVASRPGATRPGVTIAGCAVGTKNCVSCHMPKYEVPQTHASFTDHNIRIVTSGQL